MLYSKFYSKFCHCLILFVFAIFITNNIIAQEILSLEKLSLANAIEKTLSQNYDIQVVKTQIEVTKVNNSWEAAGKYPTFVVGINQNNTLANIIKPAPFQLQGTIINNGIVPNLAVNWVLFNGYGIRIEKQRLNLLQQQAEGNAVASIQTTLQNLILNYYNIQLLQKQANILENVMLLSRQKYEYLQFKKQIGGAIVSEVWQEQNNYLSDSVAVITQKLSVRNAMRNLNLLMAEKETEKIYMLTDSLSLPVENYDFKTLQDKMLSNNINLKNQLLANELLQNNMADAKAAQSPTLSFAATSNYNMAFQNLDNATRGDGTSASSSTGSVISQNNAAGFVLTMPIFNNGIVKRNLQTAKLQLKIGEMQTEQLKLRLSNVLQQSLDQYQVRKQLQQIATINEKLAYNNLQLAADRFKTGKINTFEYRILQENYLNIASTTLQTRYQVIEANMQLTILTGGILEEK
jgi:outer membrane protein